MFHFEFRYIRKLDIQNINRILKIENTMSINTEVVFLASILISVFSENQTNFIQNGGFETPLISPNVYLQVNTSLMSWSGIWQGVFDLYGSQYVSSYNIGYGQSVDLVNMENGYVQQSFILPYNGTYQLNYLQRARGTSYSSYMAEIYWNDVLITTAIPNTTEVTNETIEINTTAGNNTLKFVEIGDTNHIASVGLFIDEISLYFIWPQNQTDLNTTNGTQTFNQTDLNITNGTETLNETNTNTTNGTLNQTNVNTTNGTLNQTNANTTNGTLNQTNANTTNDTLNQTVHKDHESEDNNTLFDILSIIFAFPLNQLPSLKYSVFFVEDIWLYYYNPRQYDGIVNNIFKTIVVIEKMKFEIIKKFFDVDKIIAMVPLSDYSEYTQPKFQEIETSDSVFFKVIFSFLIFTIPSNILMCFIFYQIFKAIYKYKASTIFRRYYFFGPAFLQIIFEGNIAYFTFCCFNHLTNAFSFRFADKLSLLFTIMFLFILLLLSVCFYLCIGKLLEKKSCYFIYSFYRCHQAYCYLAVYNMTFEFIKGCLHYFLLKQYGYLMASLCVLECFIIIYTIYMEKIHQIFIPKSMFSCYLCYHFCFILLNISLYVEELNKHMGRDTSFILSVQQVVIISMMVFNGLMMIVDLIPYEHVKPKDDFIEELENDVILAIEVHNQNQTEQIKHSEGSSNNGKSQKSKRKDEQGSNKRKDRSDSTKKKDQIRPQYF